MVGHLLEVAGCIFFTYTVFANFCVPEFERVSPAALDMFISANARSVGLRVAQTASDPGNMRTLLLSLFNSMLPSILVSSCTSCRYWVERVLLVFAGVFVGVLRRPALLAQCVRRSHKVRHRARFRQLHLVHRLTDSPIACFTKTGKPAVP